MQHFTREQLKLLHLLAASHVDENFPVPRKELNEIAGLGTDQRLYECGYARIKGDFIHITVAGIRQASRIGATLPDEFYRFMREHTVGTNTEV